MINKFSLSTPKEIYRVQYGDYAYWCEGVKELAQCVLFSFNFLLVLSETYCQYMLACMKMYVLQTVLEKYSNLK